MKVSRSYLLIMADQKRPLVSIVVAASDCKSASLITSNLIKADVSVEEGEIWKIERGVVLHKETQTGMLELKGLDNSGMDCDDLDLDVDGNTGKRLHRLDSDESENESHKLKRLKSFSESRTNTSSDRSQTEPFISADIHVIIVQPNTVSSISSFIFPNCKAGILVVPCDIMMFDQDKEILIKTIKEIGHYWRNSEFTHLVVVNMPSEDSQKTIECSYQIRSDLFGTHFDHRLEFCDYVQLLNIIHENVSKNVEHYLSLTDEQSCALDEYTRKGKDQLFVEASEMQLENATAILKERNIECVGNSLYKKEKIFNAFKCFITGLNSAEHYLKLKEFYRVIGSKLPKLSPKVILLQDAFCNSGLLYVLKKEKKVYVLPLIVSNDKNTFDRNGDFTQESNTLRMTFEADTIPAPLKARILLSCIIKEWIVHSIRPCLPRSTDAYFAVKNTHGLTINFETETSDENCSVDLQISQETGTEHTSCDILLVCENLKSIVKESMEGNCKHYVRDKTSKSSEALEESNWVNVEDLLSNKKQLNKGGINLLKHWFSKEEKSIKETETNSGNINKFLSKLAKLFGNGYYLFFVGQGITAETIEILRETTNNNIERLVYLLLKEWWKMKESEAKEASIPALRDAVVNDTSLKISIYQFDNLVDKFFQD